MDKHLRTEVSVLASLSTRCHHLIQLQPVGCRQMCQAVVFWNLAEGTPLLCLLRSAGWNPDALSWAKWLKRCSLGRAKVD